MRHTQRLLMGTFLTAIGVGLVIVTLFETDILPCGIMISADKSIEFVTAFTMEFLTICIIPVAMRLFRFRRIGRKLTSAEALKVWGMTRLLMLCVPMVLNTVLYYMFMNVAFGYMGIILFLCLFFIVPTRERCMSEINEKA